MIEFLVGYTLGMLVAAVVIGILIGAREEKHSVLGEESAVSNSSVHS